MKKKCLGFKIDRKKEGKLCLTIRGEGLKESGYTVGTRSLG